jgi:hypothetical protein
LGNEMSVGWPHKSTCVIHCNSTWEYGKQAISNFTRNGFVGSDLWVYWNHLDVHRHLPRTL